MPEDQYIEFDIDLEGNVQIKPHGFGDQCLAATASFEEMLGKVNDNDREMNEEFHKPAKRKIDAT